MFIALDGFETEHDALRGALAWRRAMKGLRRLVHEREAGNYRGEVTVNCVFQDSMVGKLFDFVTFVQDEELTRSTSATHGTSPRGPQR